MRKQILIGALVGSLLAVGVSATAQSGSGGTRDGMMGGPGRGMMGRLSPDDMSAFVDAHIAALRAGLKLSAEQEKLWPPVEEAMRSLARLHLTHMQGLRQSRGTMADDSVGLLRIMADRMSQGAEAVRELADAAAPLYATLDDAQKRRLQMLVRMRPRGMMGSGMMGLSGRGMMRGWFGDDDEDQDDH
ncbi:Spy/CpxP family protein refolding chaperone [Microvirga sp. VF16]|uniref:Spy/CpxP family protein refolding chaperone n=1 Tax=Microvirga sp. VF16 TaxID=2807101 RepID=UPI00193E16AC|nr:Spy/CpxP family protein refolding chaperone [Microvirga sp. VF16]QRM34642.1 Spy/CpxP family protein refolding chaperone [Microvirga sp. VF16]